MLKKIFALILAAALLGSIQACQMPDKIFADDGFSTDETNDSHSVSQIYDFAFTLDQQTYELPVNYSVLSSRGWVIAGTPEGEANATPEQEVRAYTEDSVLAPQEYSDYVNLKKGDELIAVRFFNEGRSDKELTKCKVVGVRADAENKENPAFYINKEELALGARYDVVLHHCGKPSYTQSFVASTGELASVSEIKILDTDEDTETTLYYKLTDHSFVAFALGDFNGTTNSVTTITMENDFEKEKPYDYSKEYKYQPDNIALYNGPNLLGTQFSDFSFKYEGNLYTLPIPVRKLLADGWAFERGYGERIPMGTTMDGLVMRKSNLAISMKVHNFDTKYAHTAVNCYAVSLEACITGPHLSIMLSKGVTLGSTEQKLIEAFGKDYVKNHTLTDEEGNYLPAESEVYEVPEMEGYTIEKTVGEEYTVYSYVMPDDVPSVELPVSITDIGDTGVELLGSHRKHIDVYVSNDTHLIYRFYLQNCPEYVVDEQKIIEEQLEAARQKEKEEWEKKQKEEQQK